MVDNLTRFNDPEPSAEVVDCVWFIARAETVHRHIYRKLALARLDEFLDGASTRNLTNS